jgi:hypothetical protein
MIKHKDGTDIVKYNWDGGSCGSLDTATEEYDTDFSYTSFECYHHTLEVDICAKTIRTINSFPMDNTGCGFAVRGHYRLYIEVDGDCDAGYVDNRWGVEWEDARLTWKYDTCDNPETEFECDAELWECSSDGSANPNTMIVDTDAYTIHLSYVDY